jgi:hypothetical protein
MSHCQQPSPPLLIQGVQEFNGGQYFVCHETLEALWMQEPAPVRELYQGILQVGVGLYKWQRNQYRGAVKLLRTGVEHLQPFVPACQGVDVVRLIADANRVREALVALGPEAMQQLDRRLIPKVRWASAPDRAQQAQKERPIP